MPNPRILFVKTSSLGDVVHNCAAVTDVARSVPGAVIDWAVEDAFAEVVTLIQSARHRAWQGVNTELVGLYWQVGEYISRKLASAEWGDGVVDELARYLARWRETS